MATPGPIVGIGELLWDLLPSGPQPGGAPFNFAFHCHQLGHPAVIVSRVGNDELGYRLRKEVQARGLTDEFIQVDPDHPTGTGEVKLNERGQPSYTIIDDVAYDFLEWTAELKRLSDSCRAVCFGTLSQRNKYSQATVLRFVQSVRSRHQGRITFSTEPMVLFDVNLRRANEPADLIRQSLSHSTWVKVNTDELAALARILHLGLGTPTESATRLAGEFGTLTLLCVTRAEDGCTVFLREPDNDGSDIILEMPGFRVPVIDSVGAGDAFAAGLLTQVLEGKPVPEAADFANRIAALVVSRPGGTPTIARREVESFSPK